MTGTGMHEVDWSTLIDCFREVALPRLGAMGSLPAAAPEAAKALPPAAAAGLGLAQVLQDFHRDWLPGFNASAGPRYFGFVTGGATPAALLGDWLTGVLDQNAMGTTDSIAPQLEARALELFRELVDLPAEHRGSFVSGATMANFIGLAMARQWVGEQHGIDIAREGLQAMPAPFRAYSATPHSSIHKALAMAGLGTNALCPVPTLPGREAIDVDALDAALQRHAGPCVVVANAGTVNTTDFDDLPALLRLRDKHRFWLHVDAAFGGYARCSAATHALASGLEAADSITIDAHKWLNVPYDCAVQFSRHPGLQNKVFNNAAGYLPGSYSATSFVHLTPENSRRLRALPVWFTLQAYGKAQYAAMIERHCALARQLSDWVDADPDFERLAPTRLNGVCLALRMRDGLGDASAHAEFVRRLSEDGRVFLTPTQYRGQAAVRVSICNWQTQAEDIATAWEAMRELHPRPSTDRCASHAADD